MGYPSVPQVMGSPQMPRAMNQLPGPNMGPVHPQNNMASDQWKGRYVLNK